MKYKTVTEIMQDESLSLSEIEETISKFLSERGMTEDEFFYETEEGQKLLKLSDEARFSMTPQQIRDKKL